MKKNAIKSAKRLSIFSQCHYSNGIFHHPFNLVCYLIFFTAIHIPVCQAQTSGVTGFNLIDSQADQVIRPLNSGDVINLATLPSQKINVQALVTPTIVGSVVFNLSGQETKNRSDESGPTYSLFGDKNGNYYNWTPSLGNYTLTAQTFSRSKGRGTPGTALTITFSVINQLQFNLNTSTNGSGSVTKNPDQATYTNGDVVMLTATPDPGFQFDGWSGDASGTTNPLTVTMNTNKNITATFSAIPVQYILNVTENGSGSVTKSPDQLNYNAGSSVMLTANPDPGYQFDGWSGDASGTTNPLNVTMNANKNITATFSQIPGQYVLITGINGSGMVGKSPDKATYNYAENVTLTATPNPGFQFDGWSGDTTATSNPLTITMKSNKSVTAIFSQIPSTGYCGTGNADHIGCFTSVRPIGQSQIITYPTATHRFQLIARERTTPYTTASGTIPGNFDFAGYVAINGSNHGYLSLNHERTPGQISILDIQLNPTTLLWNVIAASPVNFGPVVRSERNCGGTVTAWGTVISAEESFTTGDNNADGYQDIGWLVEINPATGLIPDYDGNGSADKLWAMGRMRHENLAIMPDGKTVYFTEDGGTKCIYKFMATQPQNLSAGILYVLKRDNADPTQGSWIQVPNTTQSDRNNTPTLAIALGGTKWGSLEEIEIGPDNKIYFTETKTGTIWRFQDQGAGITGLEPWVTSQFFNITYDGGVQAEDWGVGADNLAFDGDGNLWVMQDNGRANVWVVRPDHTMANPKIELFMTTPFEAEPTGLTFSPDYRYGFLSIQNPSSNNTQTITDAAGTQVRFNTDCLIVFANKKYLGPQTQNSPRLAQTSAATMLNVVPNPFSSSTTLQFAAPPTGNFKVELLDMKGRQVRIIDEGFSSAGKQYSYQINGQSLPAGIYNVRLTTTSEVSYVKIVLNK